MGGVEMNVSRIHDLVRSERITAAQGAALLELRRAYQMVPAEQVGSLRGFRLAGVVGVTRNKRAWSLAGFAIYSTRCYGLRFEIVGNAGDVRFLDNFDLLILRAHLRSR